MFAQALDFSFAGPEDALLTSCASWARPRRPRAADLAASYQPAIVERLPVAARTRSRRPAGRLAIGGGVAANGACAARWQLGAERARARALLCTDNAATIASAARFAGGWPTRIPRYAPRRTPTGERPAVMPVHASTPSPAATSARTPGGAARAARRAPFELTSATSPDEALHRAYFERIPVVALDGEELFDYFVDEALVRKRLAAAARALELRRWPSRRVRTADDRGSSARRDGRRVERLSLGVAARLSRYLQVLTQAKKMGKETISSQELADYTNVNSTQIRRDLSNFGKFGKRGVGYNVDRRLLADPQDPAHPGQHNIALFGAGHLGQAIAGSDIFADHGFRVAAIFDVDPTRWAPGRRVEASPRTARGGRGRGHRRRGARRPGGAAQALADDLVEAGVRIIFNYSESLLAVPPEVTVHTSNPAVDLLHALYFHLA